MSVEYGEIKIPKDLIAIIEERVKETEFESVDEYATFVLEEVVKDDDEEIEEVFSEEDEEKVKERLKALGYLD